MRQSTLATFVLLFVGLHAFAQQQDANKVLRAASIYGHSPHLTIQMKMTIQGARGTRERELVAYLVRSRSGDNLLVRMTAPAFLTAMKFLTIRRNDHRNTWVKTSRGVRRLGTENRSERLFDSDFTVEDLAGTVVAGAHNTIAGAETIEGHTCTVIDSTGNPASDHGATYARRRLFVTAHDGLVMRVQYFDKAGRKVREYDVLETEVDAGELLPKKVVMRNFAADTSTTITFEKIDAASRIPSSYFQWGNL